MRVLIAASAGAALLLAAAATAHAEKRLFIIPGGTDGYGVDHCLTSGAACGETVANTYCHSHRIRTGTVVPESRTATHHHRRHPDERTRLLQRQAPRDDFVAIELLR